MRIFRLKPRCPLCDSKNHVDPSVHEERLRELESEIPRLQELCRDMETNGAPRRVHVVAENELIRALDDRDIERQYIARIAANI